MSQSHIEKKMDFSNKYKTKINYVRSHSLENKRF